MPDQNHFVQELREDLNRIYGLDPELPNYPTALEALATDLFDWARASAEEASGQHHLIVEGEELSVEGRPYPDLARIKSNETPSSDWDSSDLRGRLYNR